jgi:hypothetical protein
MSNQPKPGGQPEPGGGIAAATIPEVLMEDAPEPAPQRAPTEQTPVNHQKLPYQEDIQRLTAYLSEMGAKEEVMGAWLRLQQSLVTREERVGDGHMTSAILAMKTEMQAVKEDLRIMGNKLTGLSLDSFQTATGSSGKTYASVAAGATEIRRPGQIPLTTGIKPVPARLEREILVHTGDKTFEKTGAEVAQAANNQMAIGKALACRRLQSGDYAITLDTKEAKEHWQSNTSWLSIFGTAATVTRREFAILAHGIVINQIQTQNQSDAIQKIYDQNAGLQHKVQILRVAWTRRTIKKWEQRGRVPNEKGPLLISLASPEQANHLIDAGLIWGYQIHECEPYCGDCQVTQCFRCYKYGHTQRMCTASSRCGVCSQLGHKEEDCQVREDQTKWRCTNCPQGHNNHTSWSHKCPIRQQKQHDARKAYQERPYRFQESSSPKSTPNRSPIASSPPTSSSTSAEGQEPAPTQEIPDDIWEEVTSRRRTAASPQGSPIKRPRLGPSNIIERPRLGAPTTTEKLQKAAGQAGQAKINFISDRS